MILLSTKKLDEKFKLAFYKNGISLVEEPMIKTTVRYTSLLLKTIQRNVTFILVRSQEKE